MPYCQATLVFLNSLTLIFQTIFFALLEGPLEGPARRMDVLTYFSSKFSTNFRKQTRFFSAQLHVQNKIFSVFPFRSFRFLFALN